MMSFVTRQGEISHETPKSIVYINTMFINPTTSQW